MGALGLGGRHRPLTCTWLHRFLGKTVRPPPGTRPVGSHWDRDPDPPGEAARPTNGEIHASAIRLQELPTWGGRPVISPDDCWVSSGTAPHPCPPPVPGEPEPSHGPPGSRRGRRVHTGRALGQEWGGWAGVVGTRGQQDATAGGGAPGPPRGNHSGGAETLPAEREHERFGRRKKNRLH